MALWDWLTRRSKPVQVSADSIWLTLAAKLQGIRAEIKTALDSGISVLLVSHFPATAASLAEDIQNHHIECVFLSKVTSDGLQARLRGAPHLMSAAANSLVPEDFPVQPEDTHGGPRLAIVVTERHFVRAKDDGIVLFAERSGIPARLGFHLSLEDPLLREFVGSWTEGVLRGYGMTEDTPIKSAMVSRRIKAAQAKLVKHAAGDREVQSAEDWLQLNLSNRAAS